VGSHTIAVLLDSGYQVVVIDNYANIARDGEEEKPACLTVLEKLTGATITFYAADLRDKESLLEVFRKHKFDCVVHLASLKAVGESVSIPLEYYKNNIGGTINLLEAMREFGVKKMVFSSSATVYGQPEYLPLDEEHPAGRSCASPYGKSKYFIEEVLKDLSQAEPGWSFAILRYFNPVGAHKSGLLGENPNGIPNNLMPYICKVAAGKLPEVSVFGDDYDTRDGTGLRDYIHVVDLANGHTAALAKLREGTIEGAKVYNLGTGKGHTVFELIKAFEKASKIKIPYKVVARRRGDVAILLANVQLAEKELGWKATRSLDEMCEDTWRWVLNSDLQK